MNIQITIFVTISLLLRYHKIYNCCVASALTPCSTPPPPATLPSTFHPYHHPPITHPKPHWTCINYERQNIEARKLILRITAAWVKEQKKENCIWLKRGCTWLNTPIADFDFSVSLLRRHHKSQEKLCCICSHIPSTSHNHQHPPPPSSGGPPPPPPTCPHPTDPKPNWSCTY